MTYRNAFRRRPSLPPRGVVRAACQVGASLLEVLAYTGVAAIVIAGAVGVLGSALSSSDSHKTIVEVNSLRIGVKSLLSSHANFGTAALNDLLIASRVLPSTLLVNAASGSISNLWGGAVIVQGYTNSFTISYDGIPRQSCSRIASTGINGSFGVSVNGVAQTIPVKPAAADSACGQPSNTIVWAIK